MVLHPHGSLGVTDDQYASINDTTYQGGGAHLKYGDYEELLRRYRTNGEIPNVTVVDDLKRANNPCYCIANNRMNAQNVLCIGLSKTGIARSDIHFEYAKHVYYSGGDIRLFNNFIPLSMYAEQIIRSL